MNLVWFKKDLRTADHQPLSHSVQSGKTVGLYIFEPEWLESAEFDPNHLRFAIESLEELRESLSQTGIPLVIRTGNATDVFQSLHREHKISRIFAHEETGLDWTYRRDLKVISWTKREGIPFTEFRQHGVIRALKDRDTWNDLRKKIIERPLFKTVGQSQVASPWTSENLPNELLKGVPLKPLAQKGGRKIALSYLDSFLSFRGEQYSLMMSSPLTAFDACSRVSPYLTWGNLSLSEVTLAAQRARRRWSQERGPAARSWQMSIKSFENRLWWRCHFVQKMESEPEIEFENFNRAFDGMRESQFDTGKFEAWCRGETGFPLIDACMRALHQNGWINFRMRAMLMSFASYQLWLHWKKPAEFLARQFLDFEPGIHYSQAQMQSGVTGINTIRIYSPKKQLLDQDPNGEFVKKYVPELAGVAASDLAEPHLMPPLLMLDSGFSPGVNYPLPIVDPETSYKEAQTRIFEWKNSPEARAFSKHVLKKHGSRKSEHFQKNHR